ncbi:MAG: tetratricopeptide repeat protein [Sphingobacteriales bacterium]
MFFALPQISPAQNVELINSGELIKHGTMLHDSGQYKKALLLYEKVNRSDTNYVRALYEKAMTCEADSQFSQGLKYCREGLSRTEQRDYEPELYTVYGNILSDMGQNENAIKVYDAAIAKYPSHSLLYFNKGLAQFALNRLHEAELTFENTLLINPYMYSAHYQLGVVALKQGKIVPSFLSFIAYLLTNPSGRYASKCITLLSQISKSADDIVEFKNKRTDAPGPDYQDVEEIVLSKIALDPGYKPLATIDDPIIRQIQVAFEKLQYNNGDKDFWIQYYVPFFKDVYNTGKFDLFIHHVFSDVNLPAIKDYNKKNKKELGEFANYAAAYFNILRSTRELDFNKRSQISETWVYENGALIGKGTLTNNNKSLVGPWQSLYASGNLKCTGNFDTASQRQGDWIYYYFNGDLKAKEHYKNGKLDGIQQYYFANGNLSSRENYENNLAEGLITNYWYAGNVKSLINYKLGKKEGEEKVYYANGDLQTVNHYTNGELMGISKEYYKSGATKEIQQYINGKTDGPYRSYYENGNLSSEGQYAKDNAQGEWKYYYESGKIREKYSYVNNNEEGLHQEYYENGQLAVNYMAKKAKINGEALYYGKDGKIYSTYIYDNGAVRSAKYVDATGRQLSYAQMKDHTIDVVVYTSDGVKKAHRGFDQKGDIEGPDTLFYSSGKINQVNQYKSGQLNGPSVTYYVNGNKKSEINMSNGKEDGHYVSFYADGKTETEGWMKEGQNEGECDNYDETGKLSSRSYYLNGDLDGFREDYLPTGRKTSEQKYYRGWLDKMVQYDTVGNIIAADSFPKGSGKFILRYPKGQIMAQTNYVNGDFDGPYKSYYFDGSPETVFFYKKGALDSTYTSYSYGGVKHADGRYKCGNKDGAWNYYDDDGKLYITANYKNDSMNGQKIYYFPDGKKDFVSDYKDDQLDGFEKKFDPDGELAYQIVFENDNAKAYSYIGKDGKLVPNIPIAATNGLVKAYFPNGKLSRECYYSDGIKNGSNKIYYSNGQLRSVDTAVYGVSEGAYIEYYPDGKVQSEYHYKHDNLNGICKEYDKNGALKSEITYVEGVNHGPAKYYNNGKLTKTMLYNYGKLTAVKNEK